jgi:hypothetical protein
MPVIRETTVKAIGLLSDKVRHDAPPFTIFTNEHTPTR